MNTFCFCALWLVSMCVCRMTPKPTCCCTSWLKSGSWNFLNFSYLCTEACRTSSCSPNSSRCSGRAWSKLPWRPEPGSSPVESTPVRSRRRLLLWKPLMVSYGISPGGNFQYVLYFWVYPPLLRCWEEFTEGLPDSSDWCLITPPERWRWLKISLTFNLGFFENCCRNPCQIVMRWMSEMDANTV